VCELKRPRGWKTPDKNPTGCRHCGVELTARELWHLRGFCALCAPEFGTEQADPNRIDNALKYHKYN
jgi:hypothetical protein